MAAALELMMSKNLLGYDNWIAEAQRHHGYALVGIVCDQSIRIAGDEFTADIRALRRYQSLLIGDVLPINKNPCGCGHDDIDNPRGYPGNGRICNGIPHDYGTLGDCGGCYKRFSKLRQPSESVGSTSTGTRCACYRRGLYLTGRALLRVLTKENPKNPITVHVSTIRSKRGPWPGHCAEHSTDSVCDEVSYLNETPWQELSSFYLEYASLYFEPSFNTA